MKLCSIYKHDYRLYVHSILKNNKIRKSSLIVICQYWIKKKNRKKLLRFYIKSKMNKDVYNNLRSSKSI